MPDPCVDVGSSVQSLYSVFTLKSSNEICSIYKTFENNLCLLLFFKPHPELSDEFLPKAEEVERGEDATNKSNQFYSGRH